MRHIRLNRGSEILADYFTLGDGGKASVFSKPLCLLVLNKNIGYFYFIVEQVVNGQLKF